jgi:hypothetical protein
MRPVCVVETGTGITEEIDWDRDRRSLTPAIPARHEKWGRNRPHLRAVRLEN